MILITPKVELPFASLNIDARQFKKFDASEPSGSGYQGFVNEQEGGSSSGSSKEMWNNWSMGHQPQIARDAQPITKTLSIGCESACALLVV